MPFVLFALWMVTLILLVADWKTEKTRWIASISFCGGFGALAETIKDNVIPYMTGLGTLTAELSHTFQVVFNLSYIMNHIIGATVMFISTVVYCGLFKRQTVRIIKVVAFIPALLTILVSPIWPIIHINWVFLAAWAVPYIITGTFFLYRSYRMEQSPKAKKDKLIVLAAVGGPTMTVVFTNYLARCFGFNDLYTTNIIVIGLLFIFVFTMILRSNFMGIRLKFEKDRLDSTMKAVMSGTSILNHTIKNEMMKISMSAEMCRKIGLDDQQNTYMNNVMVSSTYLLEMTKKIQNHLQDVAIKLEETHLADLVHRMAKMNELTCDQHGIRLETAILDEGIICAVDSMHVSEMLNNLIRNAMEAIKEKGKIVLGLHETKRMISITVTDDGPGISSNDMPFVMDPFFTTKKRSQNFGLGLSYCYNIMKQHHGDLELSSTEGKGTIVRLNFPKGVGKGAVS
jgi:two-component system sporulation sensor kinase B